MRNPFTSSHRRRTPRRRSSRGSGAKVLARAASAAPSRRGRGIIETLSVDRWLLITTLVLVAIGTVMVFTASAPVAAENYGRSDFFLRRQLVRALIGLVGMSIIMRVDYGILRGRVAVAGLVASLVLLLLPLVTGLGLSGGEVRGAFRRVQLGALGFQPAEIARLALVVYLADALSRKSDRMQSFTRGLLPPLLITGCLAFLVLEQPSLGGCLSLLVVGLVLLHLGGARLRHFAAISLPGMVVVALLALREPYRLERLRGFLHPEEHITGNGWQIWQSTLALASGGLSGVGLGHSRARFLFLPDPHTDFILSIVGEELGLLGLALVMGLFLIFIVRGVQAAAGAPDLFGFFLAAGITASVAVNWMINVAVVCRLIPVTGQPLPFVSFGGSSLLIHLAGVGILLNVSRSRRLRRHAGTPAEAPYAAA